MNENVSVLPSHLAQAVADWLSANDIRAERVLHGIFPLGMVQGWMERAQKAERFKRWVHEYLDSHGVPHHPPGTHGAEGCRIGDRMDWLMEKLHTALGRFQAVAPLVSGSWFEGESAQAASVVCLVRHQQRQQKRLRRKVENALKTHKKR